MTEVTDVSEGSAASTFMTELHDWDSRLFQDAKAQKTTQININLQLSNLMLYF
jgi:hypothetical protein